MHAQNALSKVISAKLYIIHEESARLFMLLKIVAFSQLQEIFQVQGIINQLLEAETRAYIWMSDIFMDRWAIDYSLTKLYSKLQIKQTHMNFAEYISLVMKFKYFFVRHSPSFEHNCKSI